MTASTLTVYGKPQCVQCDATTRWLTDRGLTFEYIDITTDEAAYAYATSLSSFRQAPIVHDRATDITWSGFSPDKLAAATEHVRTQFAVA